MNGESCSNCRFAIEAWKHAALGDNSINEDSCEELGYRKDSYKVCRRFPPTVTVNYHMYAKGHPEIVVPHVWELLVEFDDTDDESSNWPITSAKNWCGEWSSQK